VFACIGQSVCLKSFWPAPSPLDSKKTSPTFRYHSFVMTSDSRTPASQSSASMSLAQKASRLLELHHASQPLVLINAWDAASAAMIEHCGLPAIATSSAAMANALGFPDGQYLPWSQMLDAVARVCRAVKVPVTADIESGFAPDVTALETSITQIIQAGAVGVNLEDVMSANPALQVPDLKNGGLKNADPKNGGPENTDPENTGPENSDPENANPENANPANAGPVRHGSPLFPLPEQIARIQAARRAAQAAGIHLVINARTDAYWQAGVEPAEAMRNTLERGKAYLQAGADCIFIPGLRSPEHIRTVIDYLRANPPPADPLPADHLPIEHGEPAINILAGPGVPSIPELAKLGVKRVSYGSGPHRAAMGLLRRIASEAKTSGTFNALTEGAVPYEEINGLFQK
jgi:2-methylisocitrate lyase-like PEP mutase family enzyme